jgi:hypothetical protein
MDSVKADFGIADVACIKNTAATGSARGNGNRRIWITLGRENE